METQKWILTYGNNGEYKTFNTLEEANKAYDLIEDWRNPYIRAEYIEEQQYKSLKESEIKDKIGFTCDCCGGSGRMLFEYAKDQNGIYYPKNNLNNTYVVPFDSEVVLVGLGKKCSENKRNNGQSIRIKL